MTAGTPQSSRDRLKELTAILADHAEDTMDADDVDQVRGEIIELWDQMERRITSARLLLDPERQDEPDEENALRAFEILREAQA